MHIERLQDLPILFDRLEISALDDSTRNKIAAIDAVLPQTQCGLCDHPDGCLPYAVAIVTKSESHNKCVPGGQPVSDAIAQIMQRPSLEARPSAWAVNPLTQRPTEVRAIIREEDCIGCTKCIPACPVDAIVGTGKHMHTIFTDLCTGCELCLPPCPVDCIDLIAMPRDPSQNTTDYRQQEQAHLRGRYHTHLNRVAKQMADTSHAKPVTSMVETKLGNANHKSLNITEADAKATIQAAKLRTKIKKLQKQLNTYANSNKNTAQITKKQAELDSLIQQLHALG